MIEFRVTFYLIAIFLLVLRGSKVLGRSAGIFPTRLLDFQAIKKFGEFKITRASDNVIATSLSKSECNLRRVTRYEEGTGNVEAGFITVERRTSFFLNCRRF